MTTELSERFRFSDGRPMNPFWIFDKTLNPSEKDICAKLVTRGGILGRSERGFKAAHTKISDVESLADNGILNKSSLYELSHIVIAYKPFRSRYEQLEEEGGFLAANSEDKAFIRDFEKAMKIAESMNKNCYAETRYYMADLNLFTYIEAITVS